MQDESHWDSDRAYERDNDREPTRRYDGKRVELNRGGTVRIIHEASEWAPRVTMRDPIAGSTAEVQYLAPRPGTTRKMLRAACTSCDFVGREVGPAAAGDAYDQARAHKCGAS